MKKTRNIALLLAVMVFGFCVYGQAIDLTVGSGDFYVNVGDHDYLPYAYGAAGPGFQTPGLSFQSAMGDYGTWTSMQPFGQVWRPYVASDWRPYTQGHWNYTQYGPTWQGYEPWAWAGYHYGNWVYSQQGWVWIPGYEWHPGRVAWAQGYNSIGWSPMPPSGYDYSRGHLAYVGPQNQFTYNDDDFSVGIGFGGNEAYYGGPSYDPRYRNMYYNPSYLNTLASILWTFLEPNHFSNDNYADYYYGGDYARFLFDRKLVRISSRPIERVVLERIVRQPIQIRQVRTNEVQIDGRRVRIAAVQGEEEKIRKHANTVVREVIAPAFAEKGKTFKGEKAKNRAALTRALRTENAERRVETVTTEQIVRESKVKHQRREQQRAQIKERKRNEVVQVERQGKIKEKKDKGVRQPEGEEKRDRSTRVTPEPPRTRTSEEQEQEQKRTTRPAEQPQEEQQLRRERRAQEQEEDVKRKRPAEEQKDEGIRRTRPAEQETDESVQREIDRERQTREEAEVETDTDTDTDKVETDTDKKKAEPVKKSKKAKSKKAKDKDKQKKQNQEEPPPN